MVYPQKRKLLFTIAVVVFNTESYIFFSRPQCNQILQYPWGEKNLKFQKGWTETSHQATF